MCTRIGDNRAIFANYSTVGIAAPLEDRQSVKLRGGAGSYPQLSRYRRSVIEIAVED